MAKPDRGGLARWLRDSRTLFVLTSLAASAIVLGRSLVAMASLGEADLGRVTLVQTAVLVLGLLQLGLWNGGYRLMCDGDAAQSAALNRMAWQFLGVVSALALVFLAVDGFDVGTLERRLLVAFGLFAGVATLARTWVTNQYLAQGDLGSLNRLGIISAVASLVPLAAITIAPLWAVVGSIALHPLVFLVIALWERRDFRPSSGALPSGLVRRALVTGFALFATGLALQLAMVAERSFVTTTLGLDALGRLFLAYLYVPLFQLVPNAFEQIFLRRVVGAYGSGDTERTGREIGTVFALTAVYCAVTVGLTLIAGPPVLTALFPERAADFQFVQLLLPGLVLFTLASPLALMFNVRVTYAAYWLAYGSGTVLTIAVLLLASSNLLPLDLKGVTLLRSLAYAVTGLLLIGACVLAWRRWPEFRPRLGAYGSLTSSETPLR